MNNKKAPNIPPLFYENRFATYFKKKAELLKSFFAKQCTVINNSSKVPSELLLKTDKFFLKIIQNLDSEKAHDHDRIRIRMLKICGPSICKPLEIIFKSCLESRIFPLKWKKANVVPIHKKKQSLENYRPISLLPLCGNI